jgi:hypothetical protein
MCYCFYICVCAQPVINLIFFFQTELAKSWPTDEMIGRCTIPNLLVGFPIGEKIKLLDIFSYNTQIHYRTLCSAFFSGLGVAVSLLDDQTNSLVCGHRLNL